MRLFAPMCGAEVVCYYAAPRHITFVFLQTKRVWLRWDESRSHRTSFLSPISTLFVPKLQ